MDPTLVGDIPNSLIANLSAVGILGATVLAILKGWLVPRKVVEEARADREARIADYQAQVADWKAAFKASEEARQVLAGQVGELLELARATDDFIRTTPRPGRTANR